MRCADCGREKTPIEFNVFRKNITGMVAYYAKACVSCENKNRGALRDLKKIYKLPTVGECDCCGREGKLFFDHDRRTKSMRGALCRQCNCGIGMLSSDYDDEKGIEQARAYLQRWRSREDKLAYFQKWKEFSRLTKDSERPAPNS